MVFSTKLSLFILGLLLLSTHSIPTLKFNPDGEFTIVQFTDLHFCEDVPQDMQCQQLMRNILDWVKPDLVVVSGDGASGYAEGSKNPGWFKKCHQEFMGPTVEYNIPYIYILGNHDAEGDLNRTEIVLLDAQNPLSMRNATEGMPGTCNFHVPISSSRNDSEMAANIWLFDTNREGCLTHNDSWGCILPDVLDWYDEASQQFKEKHGTNVHHLGYYHIPIPEYVNVFDNHPTYGTPEDVVCCPYVNTGLFEHMKKNGDITATYVGHDHWNDYGGWLDGIELVYGRKTGYGGYGVDRGARVVVLNENINEKGQLNISRSSYVVFENGTLEFDAPLTFHNDSRKVNCTNPAARQHLYHSYHHAHELLYD